MVKAFSNHFFGITLLSSVLFGLLTSSHSLSYPFFNGYQVRELSSTISETFNLEADPWTGTGLSITYKTTICGGYPLLGGYGVITTDGYFSRNYSFLPQHNILFYQIRVYILDYWRPSDSFSIQFNDYDIPAADLSFHSRNFSSNICGSNFNDLNFFTIVGKLAHNDSNLLVKAISNIKRAPEIASFGIRDISLTFANDTSNSIQEVSCFHISNTDSIANGKSKKCLCQGGTYPNISDSSQCLTCSDSCSDCFGPSAAECYSCKPGYSFVQGECIKCHNSCGTCSGPDENQCVTCSNNLWLLPNNTCSDFCDSPLQLREQIGEFKFCGSNSSYLQPPETIHLISEMISKTGEAVSIGAIIMTIASGTPSFLSLVSLAKMMHYIRYLDIHYPPKLDYIFQNQNSSSISLDFSPDIPQSIENAFSKHTLPAKFGEYNVSSNFIINYWSTIFTLGLILLIISISSIAANIAKKHNKTYIYLIFNQIKNITRWDLFLIILCSNYDEISLYLSFETLSITHSGSWTCVLSFLVSISMNIFAIYIIARAFCIIGNLRNAKYKINPITNLSIPSSKSNSDIYEILFRGFKDSTFLQQTFLLFFLIRIYLADLILGFLYLYPLFQSIILTLMSFLMIFYLLIKTPYKEKSNLIEILTCEIILSIVNTMVLILAILDSYGIQALELRISSGDVIIICNLAFNILGVIFFIFDAISGLLKAYKIIKASEGKNIWIKLFLLIFEKDGMALEDKEPKKQSASDNQECKSQIERDLRTSSTSLEEFQTRYINKNPTPSSFQLLSSTKRRIFPIIDSESRVIEVKTRISSGLASPSNTPINKNLVSLSQSTLLSIKLDGLRPSDAVDSSMKSTGTPSYLQSPFSPSRSSLISMGINCSEPLAESPLRQFSGWDQLKSTYRAKSQIVNHVNVENSAASSKRHIESFNNLRREVLRKRISKIQIIDLNSSIGVQEMT